MGALGRYISKRLAGFAAFILGLALLNAAVFAGFFYGIVIRDYGQAAPKSRLEQTAAASSAQGLEPEMAALLRQAGVWAMYLSPQGQRLWGENLPQEVPERYTLQEVAVFTKGYLKDYPVFVQVMEDGLLVLGYPKGSYTKLTHNFWPVAMVKLLPVCAAAMLALDLALLLAAYFYSKRNILKGTAPLVEAMDAVAKGQRVNLPVQGELAQVAGSLNRVSALLARQNQARANWISGVSHDIRTPLALILGYASRIAAGEGAEGEVRAQARLIQRQSEAIGELVQDLNLASQLEYEMQPLHMEQVCLARLVRSYAAQVLNGGANCSLEVEIDPAAQQALLECDRRLITRALANLVQNSLRHNPEGCRIRLLLERTAGGLCLVVEDDGKGMPPDVRRALEEQPQEGGLQPGHGLGLRLVQRIAQAHGGEMKIEPPLKKGCRVSLLFPAEKH